ncbi:hypothetical protein B0H15DRAFT_614059 [Mycena belliarum]|uniref:Uncharacterized protein n=1 Tax=Mycena belliarum TaxID=1033014 RepID=A0AAD6XFH4_9AGAR|nr:hypothetical protein B0H15DRAFT_614059 [Mycena belliae]
MDCCNSRPDNDSLTCSVMHSKIPSTQPTALPMPFWSAPRLTCCRHGELRAANYKNRVESVTIARALMSCVPDRWMSGWEAGARVWFGTFESADATVRCFQTICELPLIYCDELPRFRNGLRASPWTESHAVRWVGFGYRFRTTVRNGLGRRPKCRRSDEQAGRLGSPRGLQTRACLCHATDAVLSATNRFRAQPGLRLMIRNREELGSASTRFQGAGRDSARRNSRGCGESSRAFALENLFHISGREVGAVRGAQG